MIEYKVYNYKKEKNNKVLYNFNDFKKNSYLRFFQNTNINIFFFLKTILKENKKQIFELVNYFNNKNFTDEINLDDIDIDIKIENIQFLDNFENLNNNIINDLIDSGKTLFTNLVLDLKLNIIFKKKSIQEIILKKINILNFPKYYKTFFLIRGIKRVFVPSVLPVFGYFFDDYFKKYTVDNNRICSIRPIYGKKFDIFLKNNIPYFKVNRIVFLYYKLFFLLENVNILQDLINLVSYKKNIKSLDSNEDFLVNYDLLKNFIMNNNSNLLSCNLFEVNKQFLEKNKNYQGEVNVINKNFLSLFYNVELELDNKNSIINYFIKKKLDIDFLKSHKLYLDQNSNYLYNIDLFKFRKLIDKKYNLSKEIVCDITKKIGHTFLLFLLFNLKNFDNNNIYKRKILHVLGLDKLMNNFFFENLSLLNKNFTKQIENVKKKFFKQLENKKNISINDFFVNIFENFVRNLDLKILNFFSTTHNLQLRDETSPLSSYVHENKVAFKKIKSSNISNKFSSQEKRNVDITYASKICCLNTPEGKSIGLVNLLANKTLIDLDGLLYSSLNLFDKTNMRIDDDLVYLDLITQKFLNFNIAEYETKNILKNYKETINNEIIYKLRNKDGVKFSKNLKEIDGIDYFNDQLFSDITLLCPFFNLNDANRIIMASNMQKQCVPLLFSEKPIIITGKERNITKHFDDNYYAKNDCKIIEINSSYILIEEIKSKKQIKIDINIWRNTIEGFSSKISAKNLIDKNKYKKIFKKGDLILESNFTNDGILSNGFNLFSAIMPFEGFNFEDSIIISDRVVKENKLCSIEIKTIKITRNNSLFGEEIFTKNLNDYYSEEFLSKLDENGIIKIGSYIKEGDILIGRLTPNNASISKGENKLMKSIFGSKIVEFNNTSYILNDFSDGYVYDIKRKVIDNTSHYLNKTNDNNVIEEIIIKLIRKQHLQIGDKICGRVGNKNIIAKIISENKMPFMSNGKKIDVCINPLGIISRMNIGQILEMHFSLFKNDISAEELLKLSQPFSNIKDLTNILNNFSIKFKKNFKEYLYDGKTGKKFLDKVVVGDMYFIKLKHVVNKKISSRFFGPNVNITDQPVSGRRREGGQKLGFMEFNCLQSYGVSNLILEKNTILSDNVKNKDILMKKILYNDGNYSFSNYNDNTTNLLLKNYLSACMIKMNFSNFNKKDMDSNDINNLYNNFINSNYNKNNTNVWVDNLSKKKNFLTFKLIKNSDIEKLSKGEVINTETLHYKTGFPVKGGLCCEKIFGSYKNFECSCKKYKGIIFKDLVCEVCNVMVTNSFVRKVNFGHITLNYPILNYLFFNKNNFSILSNLLNLSYNEINNIINFQQIVILDKNYKINFQFELVDYDINIDFDKEKNIFFGNYAIKELLNRLNIDILINFLEKDSNKIENLERLKVLRIIKRINFNFKDIIFDKLLVLPAGNRPISILSNNKLGTTDLNYLYKIILMRNNDLASLINNNIPDIVLNHSRYLLQRSIDALMYNNQIPFPLKNKNRQLVCVSEKLIKKTGLIRGKILGKRVDISARSVITPDINLDISDCSIPYKILKVLFEPFLIKKIINLDFANNISEAKSFIKNKKIITLRILKSIIKNYNVVLNRAPSLHKLNLQAYNIKVNHNLAIGIHPLVCSGYNADFDGDQMGIFLSVIPNAILDSRLLMFSSYNLFNIKNNSLNFNLSREMLMGFYKYTKRDNLLDYKISYTFLNIKDIIINFNLGNINYDTKFYFFHKSKKILTTYLNILFHTFHNIEELKEYDVLINKEYLKNFFIKLYHKTNFEYISNFLNRITKISFHISTLSGISMSYFDLNIDNFKNYKKTKILSSVKENEKISEINNIKITNFLKKMIKLNNFNFFINRIINEAKKNINKDNDVLLILNSKSRGSFEQAKQLWALRGLLNDSVGNILDLPIFSSYFDGLSSLEIFISSFGARRGSIDKVLNTSSGGFFSRRLIQLCQDIIIDKKDCKTEKGKCIVFSYKTFNLYENYILGKNLLKDFKINDYLITANTLIKKKHIDNIKISMEKNKKYFITLRNIFNCKDINKLCSFCYGIDWSYRKNIEIGTPIGNIAAQVVSEPAMQLTLRTFHLGGIVDVNNMKFIFLDNDIEILNVFDKNNFVELNNNLFININSFVLKYRQLGKETIFEKKINFNCLFYFNINKKNIIIKKHNKLYSYFSNRLIKNVLTKYKTAVVKFIDNNTKLQIINKSNERDSYCIDIQHDSKFIFSVNDGQIINNNDLIYFEITDSLMFGIVNNLKIIDNTLEAFKTQNFYFFNIFYDSFITYDKKQMRLIVKAENNLFEDIIFEKIKFTDLDISLQALKEITNHKVAAFSKIINKSFNLKEIFNYVNNLSYIREFLFHYLNNIYKNNGIVVDSKNFEIVIRKLTNFVSLSENIVNKYSLSSNLFPLDKINYLKNFINEKEIKYNNILLGMSKIVYHQSNNLTALTFKSTFKKIYELMVNNYNSHLDDLTSNLIASNFLEIGSGFDFSKHNLEDLIEKKEEFLNIDFNNFDNFKDNISIIFKYVNRFYLTQLVINGFQKLNNFKDKLNFNIDNFFIILKDVVINLQNRLQKLDK